MNNKYALLTIEKALNRRSEEHAEDQLGRCRWASTLNQASSGQIRGCSGADKRMIPMRRTMSFPAFWPNIGPLLHSQLMLLQVIRGREKFEI